MANNKKILVINPWIYDFTAYDFWVRPLGLLYLVSLLRRLPEVEVYFLDCLDRSHPGLPHAPRVKEDGRGPFPKEEVPKPEVIKDIPRKFSRYGLPVSIFRQELRRLPLPDLVLVGCVMTYWYPGVQAVIDIIRQEIGSVPVVLGGIYATLLPEHARRHSGADVVVEGPAEKALSIIWEILGRRGRDSSDLTISADDYYWPYYAVLRSKDVLPVETSQGCPLHCTFCASRRLNPNFKQNPAEEVIKFLEMSYRQFAPRHFVFYDDALLVNKDNHIKVILREIIRRGIKAFFHTPNGLQVREIDEEIALLFHRAGFRSLFLSQESFDEAILARCSRKSSPEALPPAMNFLTKAGYRPEEINVYLLVGLPDQEAESVRESILEVKKLGARPRLAFFSPVPGTSEWEHLIQTGKLKKNSDPLLQNKILFPYLWSKITPDKLLELKQLALGNKPSASV